jgi:hypothetical protein
MSLPWRFLEFALAIHIHPGRLESQNAAGGEINPTVVEVIANG